jgi:D-sedoheptulose 7-phosphate isomerase
MRAMAFNDPALLTCVGNDYGYPHVFEKPIAMFADPGDVLIAISSGGRSENILRAVDAGVEAGCRVVTMSGFGRDNPLRTRGELNFYVPSDSYGYVEITHLAVCHCIVDTIIATRSAGAPPSRGR